MRAKDSSRHHSKVIAGLLLPMLAMLATFPLGTLASDEQGQSIAEIVKRRERDIAALLAIVRERKVRPKSEVIAAIRALGQLRAAEAVSELAPIITYGSRWSDNLQHPSEQYPVAYTLEQIGMPAVDALLNVMAGPDQARASLASWMAERIMGRAARNARISEHIAKTKDPVMAKNLGRFLKEK